MHCLCHANQHLNCHVVKQLESYMCVLGFRFRLILNKLHCIIIVMTCMHASHDHADSFIVVVSFASVVCCSNLLLLG
jgi:hypothetical protein